jgi:hypothetical protein
VARKEKFVALIAAKSEKKDDKKVEPRESVGGPTRERIYDLFLTASASI